MNKKCSNALKNSDINNEDANREQPNFRESSIPSICNRHILGLISDKNVSELNSAELLLDVYKNNEEQSNDLSVMTPMSNETILRWYSDRNVSESRNADILPEQQTTDESSVITISDKSASTLVRGSNAEILPGAGINDDSDEPDDVMSDEDLLRELEMSPVLPTNFNEKSNTSEKQCSLQLQKKIEDLDKILKDKNTTLTEVLEQDKTYKNPMFLENILESNDIDEYGTNYVSNLYSTVCPIKYDYKQLDREQAKLVMQQSQQQLAISRKFMKSLEKKASKNTKSHDHIQKKAK